MRAYFIIILIVLAGCVSGYSSHVREASIRHQQIDREMMKEEVYRVLGNPDQIFEDGRHQWRVEDRDYFSELTVRFRSDGSVLDLEKKIKK